MVLTIIYHNDDANKIAEFMYDLVCRSVYEIKTDFIDKDSKGLWAYHASILSDAKKVIHLRGSNEPMFTPDGLLQFTHYGRDVFLERDGTVSFVR